MLKQRVITGIIMALLVLLGVIFLPAGLFMIASLIILVTLAGWEWARLVGLEDMNRAWAVIALLAIATVAQVSGLGWYVIAIGVVWWVTILGLLTIYRQGSAFYVTRQWILKLSAVLVLVPAWLAIVRLQSHDPKLVIYLVFLVAAMDTGAYFVGKSVGVKKLAPHLSPGKTIEGVKGGLAAALLFALLGASFFGFRGTAWVYFLLLSLLVAALSVAGDLFESMIKREAGYKDSGTLLPGHGGVLDRVDGLLAALPVFVLGLSVSIVDQGI